MIRSFQRKITLLVLGFLLVILAGVVFAINYVNWKDLTDQAQYSLEAIVKNDGRRPEMRFGPEEDIPPPWLQEQQKPEDIGGGGPDGGAGRRGPGLRQPLRGLPG